MAEASAGSSRTATWAAEIGELADASLRTAQILDRAARASPLEALREFLTHQEQAQVAFAHALRQSAGIWPQPSPYGMRETDVALPRRSLATCAHAIRVLAQRCRLTLASAQPPELRAMLREQLIVLAHAAATLESLSRALDFAPHRRR